MIGSIWFQHGKKLSLGYHANTQKTGAIEFSLRYVFRSAKHQDRRVGEEVTMNGAPGFLYDLAHACPSEQVGCSGEDDAVAGKGLSFHSSFSVGLICTCHGEGRVGVLQSRPALVSGRPALEEIPCLH